jgi:hypothetical protein
VQRDALVGVLLQQAIEETDHERALGLRNLLALASAERDVTVGRVAATSGNLVDAHRRGRSPVGAADGLVEQPLVLVETLRVPRRLAEEEAIEGDSERPDVDGKADDASRGRASVLGGEVRHDLRREERRRPGCLCDVPLVQQDDVARVEQLAT